MNKREVADELECSTRQVEKYVGQERLRVIEYVRGKTGREGVYDAEEVAQLKAELERVRNEVIGHTAQTALAATKGAQGLALVEQLTASLERQHADAQAIIAAITSLREAPAQLNGEASPGVGITDKLTLSLIEASQLSGLSRNHLRQAIEDKKLKARIIGRGWRMTRASLDAYVRKL
jgi:excisionase family DNA binding protein